MYTLISTYIFKCGGVLAFILLTVYIHTHISIYTTQYIYTYISFVSLLTALILYVLYLPVKPKPISPTYTHLYTSSSIQPWVP